MGLDDRGAVRSYDFRRPNQQAEIVPSGLGQQLNMESTAHGFRYGTRRLVVL
jgi:hypothetical protein